MHNPVTENEKVLTTIKGTEVKNNKPFEYEREIHSLTDNRKLK